MDGKIVIGTEVSTDGLDKGIKEVESNINKLDRNIISTQEKAQREVDKLNEKYEELQRQMDDLNLDNYYKEVERIRSQDPGKFDVDVDYELEQLDKLWEKQINKANSLGFQLESVEGKIKHTEETAKIQVEDYKRQKEELQAQLPILEEKIRKEEEAENRQAGITKIIKGTSKSLKDVTKRVGRWAISILGVYSAYSLIRQAMSTLSQYNEDMANKLYSIRLIIAGTLEPIVTKIVDIIYRLLTYLNMITKAWFNIDMFAKGNELALKNSNKQAKNLQKTLAGFDEINKVSDSSSAGAGSGNKFTPPDDVPEPEWMRWILGHGDELIAIISGLATALVLLKLGLDPLMSLGIGLVIGGIVYAIEKLIDYLNDPSWKNFGGIIQGIGVALAGVGIVIGVIAGATAGLPIVIAGAITLIVGTIYKYWDEISSWINNKIKWLEDLGVKIRDKFGDNVGDIYDRFVGYIKLMWEFVDRSVRRIKDNFSEIISFIKNVFSGNWKGAWENIKKIFSNIWNQIKDMAVTLFKGFASTIGGTIADAFKAVINGVLYVIESKVNSAINIINGAIKIINKILPNKMDLNLVGKVSLPRLATGGIINQPGKGVPIGGAIAGEAGREGVIPLTDSQAMEELGRSIGKYININLTNVTKLDNKQIAREQKRINAQSDFAFNR